MDVLITGANGTVGTAILEELGEREEYTITCLDVEESDHDSYRSVTADISDLETLRGHFEGQDAVIHLAAAVDLSGSWETILQNNIVGTYNVLQAASEAEVGKFLFASSIHTVGMYEIEYSPDIYDPDYDLTVTHETPVRPDSFYGLSKVFGEAVGRLFVENESNPLGEYHPTYVTNSRDFPTSFYSLRIKTVLDEEYDHPYGLAEMGVDEGWWDRGSEEYRLMSDRLKCTWLSHRDLGHLVDRCLQDDGVEYDVFWGVSDNDGTWVDLAHTKETLGYEPRDNGATWSEPPAE